MASVTTLRSRRSAAQLHALVGVEREIRAYDQHARRKYVRDFTEAFQSYERVLDPKQVRASIRDADLLLIGDYHALPASQAFAASLLEERADFHDRPLVLGLETVFSRDQHILDEWFRGEIDVEELRARMRFDLDWGYDWGPFFNLLQTARDRSIPIYGLDCMPREDLRKIAARDRHAAHKIAELHQRHPEAAIVVLFGESHLAPSHLPKSVRELMPDARLLTVLQNVDALYWRAAGELDHVTAVKVTEDVICVFNSTPLEKYENYRLCLGRWSREADSPDLGPTIYNLIDSLLRFLNINLYSSHNGTQPKFLVDLMPEVYTRSSDLLPRRILSRKGLDENEKMFMLQKIEERGSAYFPQVNAFYTCELQIMYAAEEAARFLHHACRGLPWRSNGHGAAVNETNLLTAEHRFYSRAIENALAYFGSRVLCPARPSRREADLKEWYERTREDIEQQTSVPFADFMEMMDFLVLHRELERKPEGDAETPELILRGINGGGAGFEYMTQQLGYMLGTDLYDAYLDGRMTRSSVRQLFLAHLEVPGTARQMYFTLSQRLRAPRKPPRSAK